MKSNLVSQASPPPRFLQRWAYWIIGVVVVLGFINAQLRHWYPRHVEKFYDNPIAFFREGVPSSCATGQMPSNYRSFTVKEFTFDNPELEKCFNFFYRELRKQAGQEDSPDFSFYELKSGHLGAVPGYLAYIEGRQIEYPDCPMKMAVGKSAVDSSNPLQIGSVQVSFQQQPTSGMLVMRISGYVHCAISEIDSPLRIDCDVNASEWAFVSGLFYFPQLHRIGRDVYFAAIPELHWARSLPPHEQLEQLQSPESLLEAGLASYDRNEEFIRQAFHEGTLFIPQDEQRFVSGTGYVTHTPPPFHEQSMEDRFAALDKILDDLDSRREFLKQHYREIHAQIEQVIPLDLLREWEQLRTQVAE